MRAIIASGFSSLYNLFDTDVFPRFYCRSSLSLYVLQGLLLTLVGFGSTRFALAEAPGSLTDRFLTEAPQKEAEYRSLARRFQGSISTKFTVVDQKGKVKNCIRSRKEIKQNEQCASFLYQSFDGEKAENDDKRTAGGVYVVNPRYAFELKRGNSKLDWVLGQLDPRGDGTSFTAGEPTRDTTLSWVSMHFDVYGRVFSSLIHEPNFRVIGARPVIRNGRNFVQIDFECPHPIKKYTRPYFVQSGSLLLDPVHYWCMQEYDLKIKSIDGNGTNHAVFEFREGSNRLPTITRMVRTGKSPLGNSSEEIFEFDLHEASELPPEKEFTLSAFGLPEPMGVKPLERSHTWFWLSAATVGLAGLAILFAWLKRRREAAVHAKAQVPLLRSSP